jgi:IclR family acetate operon transcriptional repressor
VAVKSRKGVGSVVRPPETKASAAAGESSLSRAMRVLNALAASDRSLSPADIAERTGMSTSAASAQLRALSRAGLVEVAADAHGYQPGPAVQHLEALMTQNHSLMARVQPVLAALVQETDETATYNVLSHDRRTLTAVAKVYGSASLQYELPLGQPTELVTGAGSKAVLAYLDEDARDLVLSAQLPSRDAAARRRLLTELSAIRAEGYSVTKGERLQGAVGIAAPVFGAGERVAGSLLLTVPELRFSSVPLKKVVKSLLAQAKTLSYRLGGDPARARG